MLVDCGDRADRRILESPTQSSEKFLVVFDEEERRVEEPTMQVRSQTRLGTFCVAAIGLHRGSFHPRGTCHPLSALATSPKEVRISRILTRRDSVLTVYLRVSRCEKKEW